MSGCLLVCCNNPSSHRSQSRSRNIGVIGPSRGVGAGLFTYIQTFFGDRKNKVRTMGDENVASLIGSPALNQLVDKVFSWRTFTTLIRYLFLLFNQFVTGKSDSEKKEMLKKIESQLLSNGKEKLTVDEYYNVLKVQVLLKMVEHLS